ncbi:zinc-finger domain-containing protein [Bacillus aerolatus]|uniref:Zinc-finger domain-containing protein n=1 Tax=Bacillus aerolatus TaxID=2653354 RepID=A0A6I1FJY2_9BACI|nr:zinc-finger domain-containing protein [Bacillus aerolatus]KAB7708975.1 zinc-finger domain-containing protein [Bacillus aerolatus]
MERKQLMAEVEELLHTYCEDCLLKAAFRKEKGKSFAHKFCITTCTVGEQLRKRGEQLLK